ncbi:MAG: DUF4440 domain-containing protein [Vicinamibacterales bacterium]
MTKCSAVLLALALTPACAPKVNDLADVQAVRQTMEAYTQGIVARDAPASVAMMTDETAYFEPHMPAMTGKDAVAAFHQMLFGQFDVEMTTVAADVQVEGNLAIMHGTYTNKLVPKADWTAAHSDTGNWTVAARRQGDGSWKWDWVMGASDQPVPGTTADGADEQALLEIERGFTAAAKNRDIAFFERHVAQEHVQIVDGKPVDFRAQLAAFKSGLLRIESAALRDVQVRVFGDAAIVSLEGEATGTYRGKPFADRSRGVDFFAKRDGRWQVVYSQMTSVRK